MLEKKLYDYQSCVKSLSKMKFSVIKQICLPNEQQQFENLA